MSDKKQEAKTASHPPAQQSGKKGTDHKSSHQAEKKEEGIEIEGVVKEAVKGAFRVEIPSGKEGVPGHVLLAHPAGKLRKNNIKIVPGDRVKVEVSPYDLNRGRITYRLK